MIDQFTKDAFEAALPRVGSTPLWTHLGLREGEHAYLVRVAPEVFIYIRSTVRAEGRAAAASKDSIRCWLARDPEGAPLGSKASRWITRVSGWDRRLVEELRLLWRLGRQLKPCPECGGRTLAKLTRKVGPNEGRWFASCEQCGKFIGWLRSEPAAEAAKEK